MIKYFTIEDLLKHYLQKKFHILSLSRWQKKLRETGDIESRGSGNYACSSEIDFIAFE